MSRRARAWQTLEAEFGSAVSHTSDLGRIWGRRWIRLERKLANDLESTEMARQACDTFNDAVENDGWKLAGSALDAYEGECRPPSDS